MDSDFTEFFFKMLELKECSLVYSPNNCAKTFDCTGEDSNPKHIIKQKNS